jgi:hypothetical protein
MDFTAAAVKMITIMCNFTPFIFTLIQFFYKLIFKKRQFSKIVTKLVYISELLSTFFVIFFSLCSLLLWQEPILYSNTRIIIVIIVVINLVRLHYVVKM